MWLVISGKSSHDQSGVSPMSPLLLNITFRLNDTISEGEGYNHCSVEEIGWSAI